ncbi:DUF4389 domain-containing protein [Oceanospirillum beijerinckii]|uniref:DUF4389 domain-containing protein n=1 Tax=Oceanospirillum beijerinckii TaxID=64976 RepID=UPI0004195F84|nr:DUF4389 domain-containing protein [Oceanospirillum beijerinckii]
MSKKKAGIATEAFWLRLIFMLFFVLAYQIAELLILLGVILQLFFIALTGEKNLFLQQSAANLTAYAYQLYRYLTFNSEHKPFPFAPWPEGESPDSDPYRLDE